MLPRRLAPVLLATASVVLATAASFASAQAGTGEELLPDLTTLRPMHLRATEHPDKRRLRFTNSVGNKGRGPLEIYPESDPDGSDCDGDGATQDDREAFQRVFEDANANQQFDREVDVEARTEATGCTVFHQAHDHWHLEDFAAYKLRREDTDRIVARAPKVSFCLRDNVRSFPEPGSPQDPYYEGCTRSSTQGLSVGWTDIYLYVLPDQDLDITGLPPGRYCLISRADPAGRLDEADNANNLASALLRLGRDSVRNLRSECAI